MSLVSNSSCGTMSLWFNESPFNSFSFHIQIASYYWIWIDFRSLILLCHVSTINLTSFVKEWLSETGQTRLRRFVVRPVQLKSISSNCCCWNPKDNNVHWTWSLNSNLPVCFSTYANFWRRIIFVSIVLLTTCQQDYQRQHSSGATVLKCYLFFFFSELRRVTIVRVAFGPDSKYFRTHVLNQPNRRIAIAIALPTCYASLLCTPRKQETYRNWPSPLCEDLNAKSYRWHPAVSLKSWV